MKQSKKIIILLILLVIGITVFVVANTVKAESRLELDEVYGKKPKKSNQSNSICFYGTREIKSLNGARVDLSKPQGVALDSQGNIYIADTRANQIKKIDSNGMVLQYWGKPNGKCGKVSGEFCQPRDIALDGNDNLYVADYQNHRVQKLSANGTWEVWCKKDSTGACAMNKKENRGFSYPYAIAADNFSVYVADASKRIQVLHANGGSFVKSFTVTGVRDIAFNPTSTTSGAQSLYLAVPDSIRKFNRSENWIEEKNGNTVWPLKIKNLIALALDNNGNIYTATGSGSSGRFQKYDSDGGLLMGYQHVPGKCQPGLPQGAAFANDSLYVMDYTNDRLLKIKEMQ